MTSVVDELWRYVKGHRWLSPSQLLRRVASAATSTSEDDLDYRSRLMIRDALDALAEHYGRRYVESRISRFHAAEVLKKTWATRFDDDVGFPSLKHRLMEPLAPDDVLNFLRDLARDVREPTSITIGGSIALIMRDIIVRDTEDIHVVNDLPKSVREMHAQLNRLKERHELVLGHFASHYLPEGWERRTTSLGRFDQLDVRLVDAIDVLVGKLFSLRAKDFQDLRAAWKVIDRDEFRKRLARDTRGLRSHGYLKEPSVRNWYVLTGEEDLPQLEASAS